MFGFLKKKKVATVDDAEWSYPSAFITMYGGSPEDRAKREKERREKELDLLKLNERDEHDGKARKAGNYYVRAPISIYDHWISVRGRDETGGRRFHADLIPALREAIKWHKELEIERKKAEKEED